MKPLLFTLFLLIALNSQANDTASVRSPDGNIRVTLQNKEQLQYAVYYQDQLIVSPSVIKLNTNATRDNTTLTFKKTLLRANRTVIISPVPEKRKQIPDEYNELTVRFRQPFSLIVRVYNDGVAWRWGTHF